MGSVQRSGRSPLRHKNQRLRHSDCDMTDCCNVEPVHGWDRSATVKVQCHVSIDDAFFLPGCARRCASPIRPSAPRLAGLMTKEISALTGPVLELGPGTGVFSSALLERGIAERDLTLVEYERDFATLLQDPLSRCQGAAAGRARDVEDGAFQKFLRRRRQRASASCHAAGRCAGAARGLLFQPQAAWCLLSIHLRPKMPGAHRNPRLPRSPLKETLRNIPPAGVYRISRRYQPMALIEQRRA